MSHPLVELLKWTASGYVQLPDFQRGYVWDDERVRQLLVTIAVDHPLGIILMLETGGDEVHFQAKPIEGTAPPAGTGASRLLLDGQQRLTSLTQALTGDGVVITSDAGARSYFLKVADALKDPDNIGDAIVSLPGAGKKLTNFNRDVELDVSTHDLQIEQGYFPLALLMSDNSSVWAIEWGKLHGDLDAVGQLINLLTPMKSYKIPAIELDKQTSMAAVTTVFEKVNQGGVKLTVFELLTAKFAGDKAYFSEHGEAFRLRDDWDETYDVLDDYPVLTKFENDDFLQAVTLLASRKGPKATTARKEDVLKLTLQEYLLWAPQVRDALVWAAAFLDGERIHTGEDLPYPKQLVPLAVIRVLLGTDAGAYGVHARLRRWFWSGILGELYGSASETRFARDVDQVDAWALGDDGAPIPRTVEDAYFNESRLQTLRTRNSAAYKGIYALLLAEGAKDWIYNQEFDKAHYFNLRVDIHHIFPKAWCGKHDIAWELQESIVNKTPLAKTTNIKLSGNAPSIYRGTIRKEIKAPDDVIDGNLGPHQINPQLLWKDDFEAFFTDRRERLCALVEAALGKPVARDLPRGDADEERPLLGEVIVLGESHTLEFKSSARWNLHSDRADKTMEHVITKTVCGFMNADGGSLLIGVADDGEVLGLDRDMSTLGARANRDGYELFLRQLLENTLSVSTAALVKIHFDSHDAKDVCVVSVARAGKPVFAKVQDSGSGHTEFWVRLGNSTRQLQGDDLVQYKDEHWS